MPLTIWQQPISQPTSCQGRPVLLESEECYCPGTPRILENREGRRPRSSVDVFSPPVTGTHLRHPAVICDLCHDTIESSITGIVHFGSSQPGCELSEAVVGSDDECCGCGLSMDYM
jgi:hypothetical protein